MRPALLLFLVLAACGRPCRGCAEASDLRIEIRRPCADGFATEIHDLCWTRAC